LACVATSLGCVGMVLNWFVTTLYYIDEARVFEFFYGLLCKRGSVARRCSAAV